MNILVSAEKVQNSTSTTSQTKTIWIKPNQYLDLLNVVKNEVIKSIKIMLTEVLEQADFRKILIQSNRVLQNGSKIEIYGLDGGESIIGQDQLISLSKVSGFGATIHRGDSNQVVLQKKVIKQKKLKLSSKKIQKKDEEEKNKNPWSQIQDSNLDQNQSINQDDLLKNQSDLAGYKTFAKASDCMTKAKPCENCTCGRAEIENGKKKLQTGQIQSSCGKCYLGDAFRCASCPYRGLPAFQPGDQVKLNMGGEQQNIPVERVEATTTSSQNGKVKLNFD